MPRGTSLSSASTSRNSAFTTKGSGPPPFKWGDVVGSDVDDDEGGKGTPTSPGAATSAVAAATANDDEEGVFDTFLSFAHRSLASRPTQSVGGRLPEKSGGRVEEASSRRSNSPRGSSGKKRRREGGSSAASAADRMKPPPPPRLLDSSASDSSDSDRSSGGGDDEDDRARKPGGRGDRGGRPRCPGGGSEAHGYSTGKDRALPSPPRASPRSDDGVGNGVDERSGSDTEDDLGGRGVGGSVGACGSGSGGSGHTAGEIRSEFDSDSDLELGGVGGARSPQQQGSGQEVHKEDEADDDDDGFDGGAWLKPTLRHAPFTDDDPMRPLVLTNESGGNRAEVPASVNRYLKDYQREGVSVFKVLDRRHT